MKKLLILLGAVALVTTGTSPVMAMANYENKDLTDANTRDISTNLGFELKEKNRVSSSNHAKEYYQKEILITWKDLGFKNKKDFFENNPTIRIWDLNAKARISKDKHNGHEELYGRENTHFDIILEDENVDLLDKEPEQTNNTNVNSRDVYFYHRMKTAGNGRMGIATMWIDYGVQYDGIKVIFHAGAYAEVGSTGLHEDVEIYWQWNGDIILR